MPEIVTLCSTAGLKAGTVVAMIGSLCQASYLYVKPAPGTPCNLIYSEPVIVPGPVEIMSAQGTIGQDEAGQVVAHIHAGLAASESRILGGHLTPTGNIVAATVEVFIQEVCGVTLTRRYDPETEFSLFFLGPA